VTIASLLVPALRWDAEHGFSHLQRTIDEALTAGVGGFLIYGGTRTAAAELAAALHERSPIPLLIAADVERGAGQQFDGCVALPPLGALGLLENPAAMRRAGQITARDLKRTGINWALAPVCDLDVSRGDTTVGTRSAGDDPARVGVMIAEWIDGCQSDGVMACAKNFPGHDLTPFHSAVDAGVASIMTAPALLSERTLSRLRDELEFDGLIACEAEAGPDAAVRAVASGCDVLLMPDELAATARALASAAQRGIIPADRVRSAIARRDQWALWARPAAGREPSLEDEIWSRQVADATVHLVRGAIPRVGSAVEIVHVDDDASGPWPVPSRAFFAEALAALEIEANVIDMRSTGTRVPVIITAYADSAAGKTEPGFSRASRDRVERAVAIAHDQKRESLVVMFSHPRHAAQFPQAPNVLCAWGGEKPMQFAAARVVARASR
jgi:beta-glucosidase-like glycosyl hydrolase